MFRLLLPAVWLAIAAAQNPPAPFKPTAELGKPFLIGEKAWMDSKVELETGTLRNIILDSAELALMFPNNQDPVVAEVGQKLLILRGRVGNPYKEFTFQAASSHHGSLRVFGWDRNKPGTFNYITAYDPETLKHLSKYIKPGEYTPLIAVFDVPAALDVFRIGLYFRSSARLATYDLAASIGRLKSVFAAPDGLTANPTAAVAQGQTFDFDSYEMTVHGITQPDIVAGQRWTQSPRYVLDITATNRALLPARWGWQYHTAELIASDGTVVPAYRDLIDKTTDRAWAGDVPGGATVTSRLQFYPNKPITPKTFRMTFLATKRTVEVNLSR